jgi:hypothetical protein
VPNAGAAKIAKVLIVVGINGPYLGEQTVTLHEYLRIFAMSFRLYAHNMAVYKSILNKFDEQST